MVRVLLGALATSLLAEPAQPFIQHGDHDLAFAGMKGSRKPIKAIEQLNRKPDAEQALSNRFAL